MSGTYRDFKQVQAEIPYFQFPRLALDEHLMHGVFTRRGGLSKPPFDGLNVSHTVGDHPEAVTGNIQKIKDVFCPRKMVHLHQCHGNEIVIVDNDFDGAGATMPFGDALMTNIPHVALMVKQADCQGVLIYDPPKKVIAVVHCGWRGNVQNILGAVVDRMSQVYGSRCSDLLAAIGPSLGPCCAEFVTHEDIFPPEFIQFMVRKNYFDLWAVSRHQLVEAGLYAGNIEVAGMCTRCRQDLFYSYRGEGTTGRFGTVAMLR